MVCIGVVLAQAVPAHAITGVMAHEAVPISRRLGGTQGKAQFPGYTGYSC